MSFFFSFLSSFFNFRERGYIIGYREKQFESLLIFRWLSFREHFSFSFFFLYSRVDGIYLIFGVWLESRVPCLSCLRYFRLSFPGVLACASPHLVTMKSDPRLTFSLPTSADGRSSHFRPRAPANHLASLFFSLVRRFVRATICHPSQVTEYR